jgi:hypothetical protein
MAPPTLLVQAGTSQVREDLSHQPCAYNEEMSAALPRQLLEVNHPQVDFVNEGGGLENMPGWFLYHVATGASAQLTVNQGVSFSSAC